MENAYVNLTEMEMKIIEELEKIRIIDCHEHLPSEMERISSNVSALTMFSHCCRGDLLTAGMPQERIDFCMNGQLPFDERWDAFKPYYKYIKHTSYARSAHIAMKKFYNCDELTDKTVNQINTAIKKANKPGLYKKVLSDACNIETALTQNIPFDAKTDGLLTKVIRIPGKFSSWSVVAEKYGPFSDDPIQTIEQLEDAARRFVDEVRKFGAVGIKFMVMPFGSAGREEAGEVFYRLKADDMKAIDENNPLTEYMLDAIADQAGKNGMVVCLHTGYWGDFRTLNPSHAIPFVTRHKEVDFDLYHVGYPYVREAIMLGKGQPNVWLNMCWTYVISQKFAADALEEILEMIPLNKILGFGGDYRVVEKIYGHLIMARETIAHTLAKKINDGYMTFNQAIYAAQMMLRTNPQELYKL